MTDNLGRSSYLLAILRSELRLSYIFLCAIDAYRVLLSIFD